MAVAVHVMEEFLTDIEAKASRPSGVMGLREMQEKAVKRIQKARIEEQRRRTEREKLRLAAEEEAEDEEAGAEEMEVELSNAAPQPDSTSDFSEAEPPCFQSGLLASGEAHKPDQAPDLRFLAALRLAHAHEFTDAWGQMLVQRAVTCSCSRAPEVLQALFTSLSSSDSLLAEAAHEQLSSCYSEAASKASPAGGLWVPTLSTFWHAVLQHGYNDPCSGGSSSGRGGKENTNMREKDAAGPGAPLPCKGLHGLRLMLALLTQLCQLHVDGLRSWDFSKHQAEAHRLLLAISYMRLDPLLLTALQPQLSRSRELLVEAWACAGASSYAAAQPQLARALADAGPSHRAALRLVTCRVERSQHATKLSQSAGVALLQKLLNDESDVQAEINSGSLSFMQGLQQLLGQPQKVPRFLEAMKRPAQQQAGDGKEQAAGIDYWKLQSLIQAADAVLWPLQVEGQFSDADWHWWSAHLRALDDKLGKGRQSVGTRKLMSTVRNNYEFMRP